MNARAPRFGPRYPIPWIATYFLTALALIAGAFAVVWYLERPSSEFDYDDPDVAFLERIVISPTPNRGDFTGLNGGNWQALCLVGWQGRPSEGLSAAGLSEALAQALRKAHEEIAGDIQPSEFALIYADPSDKVRAVRLPHGFAFAHEGAVRCTTRAEPVLQLPVTRQ